MKNFLNLSGLEPFIIRPELNFVNIGERTNVTGSKKFAQLIKSKNYSEAAKVALQQVENGAQIIDVNMDDAMLDGVAAMRDFLHYIQSEPAISKVPFMIDSSNFKIIEAGLQCVQGKCIVNSISLKEGETKFLHEAKICQSYGAAVIIMAFDENGQAETAKDKVRICQRAYKLLTEKLQFDPTDIIFDLNIFAVATGIEQHNNFAVEFIEATAALKALYPKINISGGVSNLSFSFRGNDYIREAMHSIFLYHAIKAGMTMGIVNAGQLAIYDDIEPQLKKIAEQVILNVDNENNQATEALIQLASTVQKKSSKTQDEVQLWRNFSIEDKLVHALVNGMNEYIEADSLEALDKYNDPLYIIEHLLMAGMSKVGDLFSSGKMFLPQVVKSARVMKQSVHILTPFLEFQKKQKNNTQKNTKILLATVKGDVHDIGKNIVGVVLGCNGYDIVDLGVMVSLEKIIQKALEEKVDIIGLSGLITPSLQEMIYVAKALTYKGINTPLLIGGATTSKLHTAVKIAPEYKNVVYVVDASQSVQVVNKLISLQTRQNYLDQIQAEYINLKSQFEQKQQIKQLLSFEEAQKRKYDITKSEYKPIKPSFLGYQSLHIPLKKIIDFIDWKPFFISWEMHHPFPEILSHPDLGVEATKLFNDAQEMLAMLTAEEILTPHTVIGFWEAYQNNEDIVLKSNDEHIYLHHLRQQSIKAQGIPNLCLSDFIFPHNNHTKDYIGAFAVSIQNTDDYVNKFTKNNDDYNKILVQTLSDRLVEALAEYVHFLVRTDIWGYIQENLTKEEMIKEKYQGIRPAPGYPACPDHTEKLTLFTLLGGEIETKIKLTENLAMQPASAICGWYLAHPDAQYFGVGQVTDDQWENYAARKKTSIEEAQRWSK